MAGHALGLIIALFLVYNVHCQDPPKIEGSYIAWGEIVQPIDNSFDPTITLQTSFEESYNADTQNSAFFLYELGKNMTFVKDHVTNQTFLYVVANKNMIVTFDDDDETSDKPKLQCQEADEKQWMESDIAPGLLSFEDDDGTIKFSLTQLFNIPIKFLVGPMELRGKATTYRGIPARSWVYEIKTKTDDGKNDMSITVESYWSDGTWNSSAGVRMAPLGFNVSKLIWIDSGDKGTIKVEDYYINIFGFVPDAYDQKYFKAVQGVICPSRKSTLPFPNVRNVKAISFHSELALPDYQELRYIDVWFDPQSQLVRVDMERLDEEDPLPTKQKRYQSEIAAGQLGVVFRWGWDKGEAQCEVIPFNKYQNDMQNIFDIKQDMKKWSMGKIFGLNDTSYVYIGQTTKNDVPCQLFQGIRTDWPDKASNVKSLWEWCFNINMTNENDAFLFKDDDIGLISANVIILSHPEEGYNNYRMNHHFYGVKIQDPQVLDATNFDISRCFQYNERRLLQFYLDVKVGSDNKMMFANATSDVTFLQKWKDELYQSTGLDKNSLRISNVRATIDGDKVFIKFSILNAHKNLPNYDKLPSTTDAERTLKNNIQAGQVSIPYELEKGKTTYLLAEDGSLTSQINPKFEPNPMPTLPDIPTTTTTEFSLRTETQKDKSQSPIVTGTGAIHTDVTKTDVTGSESKTSGSDGGTTTPITPEKKKKFEARYTGHQPGSVAGVAISMILVGASIGAAGTFYKFNGLPECMKR